MSAHSDDDDGDDEGALALLAETRRAMEDFDDALLLLEDPHAVVPVLDDDDDHGRGSSRHSRRGGSGNTSAGSSERRCVRFHSASASAGAVADRIPARDVPQSPAPQQPPQLQQPPQERTRKFDGHRIRNLSSRIRGRMNQEQQQIQQNQQQQLQPQRQNQNHSQTQHQIGDACGAADGSRSGLPRRASLDTNACDIARTAMSSECDDNSTNSGEARVRRRRRASDDITPARDRREYRHARTSPPETPAASRPSLRSELQHTSSEPSDASQPHPPAASSSAPPTSRSLSRDELRALGRKAGAAVAGGSLIALGIPLLPMPGPVGEAMSIGGMAVLAKEFPAAQKVLDVSRDKLVEVLDKTAPPTEGEDGDGEHDEEHDEGRGLESKRAYHNGGNIHSEDGGGVIGAATNLSQRCANDSVRYNQQPSRPLPPEGDYFHLHDELLASSSSSSARHLHRRNYHHGHYGHHGHHNHRRQGSWRNRKNKQKKKKGPSKLKRSLHRSIHGMGTKVVLPLMDTVCTEREGASSSSSTAGGGGVGASTRKAFAGAKSRLRSTFQSLSNEVAAGWREVEEEYAQQAQAQAEAAKLAHMRRMQELEQQQRMRMAQEQQQQRRRQSLEAAGVSGVAIANRSVFQQFLGASNGDAHVMQRRGSYASASSSGQYEEDFAEEDDEEWETESCPERWIDVDESLWETMSL